VNTTRKVGLILAAVATALWLVIVAMFFSTGPDEGVNIGAALLTFLDLPLSIGASLTLLASMSSAARHGIPESRPLARRIGAVLAVVSAACLVGSLVLGSMVETTGLAVTATVVLVAGIVTFVASSALFALPRARRG
jgi:hypothetical protein